MKVYLVRHGQTNYNVLRLHNDDPSVDVFLTEVGKTQAKKVADRLNNIVIDHIFVSELRRTQQTAEIINKHHRVQVSIDKRLNDNKSGFEGQPDEEYETLLEQSKNKWSVHFNNGESLEDVKKRIAGFIDDLRTKKYGTCVVVTSRVPAQFFCACINKLSNEEAWNLSIDKGTCLELEL